MTNDENDAIHFIVDGLGKQYGIVCQDRCEGRLWRH